MLLNAGDGIRTRTDFRPLDFKSSAATHYATPAFQDTKIINPFDVLILLYVSYILIYINLPIGRIAETRFELVSLGYEPSKVPIPLLRDIK